MRRLQNLKKMAANIGKTLCQSLRTRFVTSVFYGAKNEKLTFKTIYI